MSLNQQFHTERNLPNLDLEDQSRQYQCADTKHALGLSGRMEAHRRTKELQILLLKY
jgi:hypothetical protein